MSVNSIFPSTTSLAQPTAEASNLKQGRQDFEALGKALSSGDLSSAQSAFAALQKDAPQSASGSQNAFQSSIDNLKSALDSGNLTAAQNAFAQIQQSAKAHHGHHGHGASKTAAPKPNADPDGDGDSAGQLQAASSFQVSA